jgi:hypothetical protein
MNNAANVITITATPAEYGNTDRRAVPVGMMLHVETMKIKTYRLGRHGWELTGRGKLEGGRIVNRRARSIMDEPADAYNFLPVMSKATLAYFGAALEKALLAHFETQREAEMYAAVDA